MISKVKAIDGQDQHGLVARGVEAPIVVDKKIVVEPNDGNSMNSSPFGRVRGVARTERKWVLERID